ncbi:MAG: MFS transporter [Acidimicrobiia bacterium]
MFAPIRSLTAFTRGTPPALLASAAAVTFMFAATPFLIAEIADRYGIGRGDAGLYSTVQVGAFALTTVLIPRFAQPSVSVFRAAVGVLVVANLSSIVAPGYLALLGTRVVSGAAAGTITWLGWAAAMETRRSLAAMSAVGPVAALVAAPVVGLLVGLGDAAVFAAIAVVALPVMFLRVPAFGTRPVPGERSGSRSNRVLLGALFLLTCSGAGLFVYLTVIGVERLGMTPFEASLGFSLNAAAGFVGARLSGRHRRPGVWLATAGPAAVLSVLGGSVLWFYVGLAWWGLAFWMGLPGVLEMLAARSLRPDERAGDAQGLMAFGRSAGPGVGGVLVDGGSFEGLALAAGIGLTMSGLIVVGVQEGREALPPSDLRTVGRDPLL